MYLYSCETHWAQCTFTTAREAYKSHLLSGFELHVDLLKQPYIAGNGETEVLNFDISLEFYWSASFRLKLELRFGVKVFHNAVIADR